MPRDLIAVLEKYILGLQSHTDGLITLSNSIEPNGELLDMSMTVRLMLQDFIQVLQKYTEELKAQSEATAPMHQELLNMATTVCSLQYQLAIVMMAHNTTLVRHQENIATVLHTPVCCAWPQNYRPCH